MPYWELITRSFWIAWNHRYLWLLAFFSGEAGGSFSGGNSYSFNPNLGRPGATGYERAPDFSGAGQQVSAWIHVNLGLLLVVGVLWLVLAVGFFIFGAACEAAIVRASAEHDAERPFDLHVAWRTGVARMWVIVRFRLLLLCLALPVLLVVVGLIAATLVAALSNHAGAAVGTGLTAGLIVLVSIPYFIYLSFLDRLGSRAAVLELLAARASIGRANRLLGKRLGRVLLVWLLSIAVGFLVAIAFAVVGAIVFLPLILAGIGAVATGASWLWIVIGLAAAVLIPILLVGYAFFAAQSSTYWTLAFRRLDLEYAPAYYPAPAAPAPPAAQ